MNGKQNEEVVNARDNVNAKKRGIPISTLILGVVAILLTGALIITLVTAKRGAVGEGAVLQEKAASSPEKALKQCVSCIADGNMNEAICSFPLQSAVDGYQYEDMLDMMKCFVPTNPMPLSTNSERQKELNAQLFEASCSKQMEFLVLALISHGEYDGSMIQPDSDLFDTFREMNDEELADLKVKKMSQVDLPNQDSFDKMAERYGADAMEEYEVVYEMNGETYDGAAVFIRYGKDYYLWGFYGFVSGVSQTQPLS